MDDAAGYTIEHLGPYELKGELGRGAMARVWRAWDPNLEREVAIKEPLFDSNLSQDILEEMGRRFVAEGKAAAKLNHPNIVTIHAADVYDGRPAIVMELIDGTSLSDLIDRGPLNAAETLSVLDQLLDAVAYAHKAGVVHRDIKPDNIFLTSDLRVKLTDFGIAHINNSNATRATVAGSVLGTPGYMSPEQATGKQVDERSDLFSVGVVAYEMLTGRNPFNPDGADSTTLLYRIVHEDVSPLSDSTMAGISADMRPAIAAALSKDPINRPQSAEAFKAMLHPASASVPVQSLRSSQISKLPKWIPYAVVAAVPAIILVLAFVVANSNSGGEIGAATQAVTEVASTSSAGTEPVKEDAYYVSVSDGYVAIFEKDRPDVPYQITNLELEELDSQTAAYLGAKISFASLDEAKEYIDELQSAYEKEEEKVAEALKPKGAIPPSFPNAAVSSITRENQVDAYGPYSAVDGNKQTAWNSDGRGNPSASGEWIELSADSLQTISGISILPGYCKNERIWSKNRAPKDVVFSFSDGSSYAATLEYDYDVYQTFDFPQPVDTTYIRITINSSYGPTANERVYDDCCISEIEYF